MTRSVSVAIPTYRRDLELRTAIESVLAQTYERFEVIVVDQSERPGPATEALCRQFDDPRLRYFQIEPPSLPAARNFALNAARGEVIVYVDDDVVVDEGFIAGHASCYDDERVGGISGRVRVPGAAPAESLYTLPVTGIGRGGFDYGVSQETETAIGCNMSFRVSVLRELGGFETSFGGTFHREDADMSLRVREAGYRILYEPSASLTHLLAEEGGCENPRGEDVFVPAVARFQNDLLLMLRHHSRRRLPTFLWAQLRFYVLNRATIRSGAALRYLGRFVLGMTRGVWLYARPATVIARETQLSRDG